MEQITQELLVDSKKTDNLQNFAKELKNDIPFLARNFKIYHYQNSSKGFDQLMLVNENRDNWYALPPLHNFLGYLDKNNLCTGVFYCDAIIVAPADEDNNIEYNYKKLLNCPHNRQSYGIVEV